MIEYENLKHLNAPFEEEYKQAYLDFIESGWYILGKQVQSFENEFANYLGVDHFVGVASGLDAIELSLRACNLPKGAEVIVPSNTYIATILAVVKLGLKPVLVAPDIQTYNLDPQKIEEKINKNTGAIVVVHLYGKCCEMDPICSIAQQYNLPIIEDAAQAHGASYRGVLAGNLGTYGAFSFYPTKNLGALGDGGGISTKDEVAAQSLQKLRNYGSAIKYHNEVVGYNSRLDELQAAFLRVKLKSLERINEHKRKLAQLYFKGLSKDFILPLQEEDKKDVFHIFNIRHQKRDALRDFLLQNGIKTEIHYPVAPHQQKAMHAILTEPCSIAQEIHDTTLSLPISYCHTEADIVKVIEVANRFITHN